MQAPLELLYRGPHAVAVDKPSGVSVHRGWDVDGPFVDRLLAEQLGRPVFAVHRLDRATSGVLLFALSSEAAAALQCAFQAGEVEKRYRALVRGIPPESGTIDHPVPRSKERDGLGFADRLPAVTRFARLGTGQDAVLGRSFSFMDCRPITGRQHQIRRHFKHLAHPLVGDVNYGKGDINRHFRTHHGLDRLALHAARLTFMPPGEGLPVAVESPLPAALARVLEALGIAPSPPFSAI